MNATHLIDFCIDRAELASDRFGFVAMKDLLEVFQADIEIRPLLVEAMVASRSIDVSGDEKEIRWLVLLDEEKFPISRRQIDEECSIYTLPSRVRNTIAHELTHSLSFRSGDFGFQLLRTKRKGEDGHAFVKRLENETEALSPLLLIPYSVLGRLLTKTPELLVDSLSKLRERCAVSVEVLIARLQLLSKWDRDALRMQQRLEDVAIGWGEWSSGSSARIYGWPLFVNFRNSHVPEIVLQIQRNAFFEAQALATASEFFLNGGTCRTAPIDNRNAKHSLYLKDGLSISVESVERRRGARFIYTIHYT